MATVRRAVRGTGVASPAQSIDDARRQGAKPKALIMFCPPSLGIDWLEEPSDTGGGIVFDCFAPQGPSRGLLPRTRWPGLREERRF